MADITLPPPPPPGAQLSHRTRLPADPGEPGGPMPDLCVPGSVPSRLCVEPPLSSLSQQRHGSLSLTLLP